MSGSRPLTDSEISDITTLLPIRDSTLVIVAHKTGLRISELLSIKVSDCLEYGSIRTHLTIARRNMKGKQHSRTIPLHPDAKLAITRLIAYQNLSNDSYLFLSREGNNQALSRRQANTVLNDVKKALELTGKVTHHSLRKSFASACYKASGRDILITQKALGHKLLTSTQCYLSTDQDEVDRIILKA